MFRKIIFWSHLVAGVSAGLVILMMSATGVVIAWEYQMIEKADMKMTAAKQTDGSRISLDQAMVIAAAELGRDVSGVTVRNDPAAPYQVTYDRRGGVYIDAYTGEVLGTGSQGVRDFLAPIRSWHRWFNVNGEGRDTARFITGASNVIFLFLLLSGVYIWLPRIFTRAQLKMRILFQKKHMNSQVRDNNWHHVFGFWSLIPLILIVVSATLFSYPSVKGFVGNIASEPGAEPQRGGGGGGMGGGGMGGGGAPVVTVSVPSGATSLSLDQLLETTKAKADGWHKISVTPARNESSAVDMKINFSGAIQPTKETTWSVDPYSGEVLKEQGWEQMTRQQKVDQFFRRIHTGEFFGFAGQTLAAIVSLFACFMVYTGFALAWRRLISTPLRKRKKKRVTAS